ncbi:MAG: ATP-binding cassette domain-containing protein [Candidatus Tyrphobacter sp.]
MTAVAIDLRALSKTYRSRIAVENLTLSVASGELFGILGPDGAGKTTTLQMLAGVLEPTSGTRSFPQASAPQIGFMSEGFSLYPTLSVEENIDFFAGIRRVSRDDRERRKSELLSFSRLDSARHRPAQQLSGGMQKKLALACALIHEPEFLFLDEPTTGVDPVSRRDFWRILERFVRDGMTIVVSTPYMDEAQRFDRVALLQEGRLIALDSPSALRGQLSGRVFEASNVNARTVAAALRDLDERAQAIGDRIRVTVPQGQSIETVAKSIHGATTPAFDAVEATLEDVFVEALVANTDDGIPLRHTDASRVMTSSEVAVRVAHVDKRFGALTALHDINLEVRRGEIFGLLGPNGSGKSTLIRILTGISVPTTGTAEVNGYNVSARPNAVKASAGYMSQKFSLYRDLTVGENIELSCDLYGLNKATADTRLREALTFSGLAGHERALTRDLAGGWLQRLALECAIVHRPSVVFLDEPTAGVDPISRRRFWKAIVALADAGTTIFVTTHYMDEAENADRIAFLYGGELVAVGSPQQLKRDVLKGSIAAPTLEDVFVALIEQRSAA